MTDRLLLKWGTVKGWDIESDAGQAALRVYLEAGKNSMSAMAQGDTEEQKKALCDLVDLMDEVHNDWTGKDMTREEAKAYILGYSS